ncbi:MAG: hypothetical protein KBT58_04820 [Bizionia sp.]|nr:hypothetical protein [Bizionia sp.]
MSTTFKYIVLMLISSVFISCGTNNTSKKAKVNTTLNATYQKSRKAFSGQLSNTEYKDILSILEEELNTTFHSGKPILINFNQKASNCLAIRFSDIKGFINKGIAISSRMSAEHNAVDFFVYTNDAYYKDIYKENDKFILESGFFSENIFTLHENCQAFIIIKPSGEFYKFYGEDYYSEVRKFLEKQ